MDRLESKFGFTCYAESRIGGRSENQDAYRCVDTPLGLLVIVCDGMGGGPAGSTASSLASDTIVHMFMVAKPTDDPRALLQNAINAANSSLLGAIATNESLRGMGTTCVAVLATSKSAYVAHVGDSRLYQLRGGQYVFRTADHSFVAEMVRKGTITEEQARLSDKSNLITRALGTKQTVEIDLDFIKLKQGDKISLMSDGVWGSMKEEYLIKSLATEEQTEYVLSEILDRVDAMGNNNGGGHDNMTLAVIEYSAQPKTISSGTDDNSNLKKQDNTTVIHKKKKNRVGYLLKLALLASLGANIYILLTIPDRKDGNEKSNIETQSDEIVYKNLQQEYNILRRKCDSLQSIIDIVHQSQRNEFNNEGKENRPGDDASSSIEDSDSRDINIPPNLNKNQEIKKQIISALNAFKTIDTLNSKRNNKLSPYESQMLLGKKYELFNTAKRSILQAQILMQDPSKKEELLNVSGDITNKKDIMTKSDSYGRPTVEAKKAIKEYSEKLNTYKN